MDLRLSARSRAGLARGDRGVTAVMFGLVLTALLAMSALAVDLGAAYTERRHDQNAADAAVMSGAVEAALGGGVLGDVVDEVRTRIDTTLGRTLSDEQWDDCSDSDQLTHTARELAATDSDIETETDCISFSATFDALRVKVPEQQSIGVFAPTFGVDGVAVSASADAGIGGLSNGLPFIGLATAQKGDFICLRTSSAKEPLPLANGNGPGVPASFPADGDPAARPDPCNSKEFETKAENFGTLKPWQYEGCTQGNHEVEIAISSGLDHPMGVFPHGYHPTPPVDPDHPDYPAYLERRDGAPFTGSTGCLTAFPNTFEVDEGLNSGGLSCALIKDNNALCNGQVPRLQTGSYVTTNDYELIGIEQFDNLAPWHFLRSSTDLAAEGFPDSCVDVAASRVEPESDDWDHYDRFDAFTECLGQWDSHGELFTEDLARSARFGFVPQVDESTLDKVDWVHVEGFLPIFLYRVYIQDNGGMCDPADPRNSGGLKVHDAGQEHDCGSSNKTIDRLSSIVLACGMVPASLCDKATGLPAHAGKSVYEVRLSG